MAARDSSDDGIADVHRENQWQWQPVQRFVDIIVTKNIVLPFIAERTRCAMQSLTMASAGLAISLYF